MGSGESKPNNGGSSGKTETKEKGIGAMDVVKAVAVAAGVGLVAVGAVAWGLSELSESEPETSDNRKMMKAPGRDSRIYRDDFERDPKSYFRDLRKRS